MKKLFNPYNPVMRFLSRLYDLLVTNILFTLCCLPVVTIGASLAAMTKITQNMVRDEDSGIFKTFFHAFRDNFRQATVLWLLLLAFFACVICNLVLIDTYLAGQTAQVLRVFLATFSVLVVAVVCYMFPLLVRYDNTLRAHCRNALLLAGMKLPKTLCLVILTVFPFAVAYLSPASFLRWSLIWTVIGFSVLSLLCSLLLRPIMAELEKDQTPVKETD